MTVSKAITPGGRVADNTPFGNGDNWVTRAGGLPSYIREVAHAMVRKGKSESRAIGMAVGIVRNWAEGKGNVTKKVQAAAAAAIAEWEAKRAGAHVAKNGVLTRVWTDSEFIAALPQEFLVSEIHKDCACSGMSSGNEKAAYRKSKKMMPKTKKKKKVVSKLEISDVEFESFASEINADDDTFTVQGNIEKRDDDKQLVFGWCSIAKRKDGTVVVDKQGDVLEDIDQMEKVAYDFVLNSRDGGEMHIRKGVSTLVESFVSTPEKWSAMGIPDGVLPTGWWVGFHVNDGEVWKAVKSGKYKMFSVHGSGLRKALTE